MVVVAVAVTWRQWHWWLSIVVVHPHCAPQHHCCHGGGNNTYNTNVSYEKTKLKELKKKNLPTAQEMLLSTSLGPFFSPIICPHCLSLSSPTFKNLVM